MAGHNKWSKIKHRKAVVDKRRGKVWTKVAKAIIVAAKHSGPDPAFNLTLRYALDEARYANMPRDVIERAIKKGAGGEDTSNYENVRYEGYAPGGIAVIVESLTDNRTRTAADVRCAFVKNDGNMGTSGCVGFMFQHLGQIAIEPSGVNEDTLMNVAVEAGASDVEAPADADSAWVVTTDPTAFIKVKDAIEKAGFTIAAAELAMVPESRVAVAGKAAQSLQSLVDELEDLDDVQKVYTNADIAD